MKKLLDFSRAAILADKNAGAAEKKAVEALAEEISKRTGFKPAVAFKYPHAAGAVIAVGNVRFPNYAALAAVSGMANPGPEGYRLAVKDNGKPFCAIIGENARGVLYGVGKFLRVMDWGEGKLLLPDKLEISSAPKFPARGTQLAYRPKTNAYDAWTPEMFDQYVRELAFFGANTFEILPPGTDDADRNSLMKYDSLEMTRRQSEIIHSYGLEVSMWFPNMFGEDIGKKEFAEQEAWRHRVFSQVPFIDHLFIPGGDPGRLYPKTLFKVARRFAEIAREYHKDIKLWLSPQTFCPSEEWAEGFYDELDRKPEWLDGVVFGPWERDNIDILRKRTPKIYPIRHYPDIAHSLRCQYPVPKWDTSLALTLGREFINPRPRDEKRIHNLHCHLMNGSVSYSEGINDDTNKVVWLAQEWNPETPVAETLNEHAALFIDRALAPEIADGLMALEENLNGPLAENPFIEDTYYKWKSMETKIDGYALNNYRFEMPLLRANFDYYQKNRVIREQQLEKEALEILTACRETGPDTAINKARDLLDKSRSVKILPDISEKINSLADLLFEHIGAQLTVTRHFASEWDRGAFVECLDIPLNDYRYITARLDEAEKKKTKEEKIDAILAVVKRTDPGEGGFYDDFGSKESWSRLENHDGYGKDPGFFKTPLLSFLMPPPHDKDDTLNVPLAWRRNVSTLYQYPLVVNYAGLDPAAGYTIRTVYGKYHPIHITLCAGKKGEIPVHGEVFVNEPFVEVENVLPKEAYESGKLRLQFTVRDGERGPNISEILIKKA